VTLTKAFERVNDFKHFGCVNVAMQQVAFLTSTSWINALAISASSANSAGRVVLGILAEGYWRVD
jgi:hypothetical protein